jgi:ribonuclease HI
MVLIQNVNTEMQMSFSSLKDANNYIEDCEHPKDWFLIEVFYCDGSGYNGEKSGFVVTDDLGQPIFKEFTILHRTNNECEYLAVIKACELALFENATIFTDSQLVVSQLLGDFEVNKPHLIPYYQRLKQLTTKKLLNVRWIARNKNKAGIYIEKYENRKSIHPSSVKQIKENIRNFL